MCACVWGLVRVDLKYYTYHQIFNKHIDDNDNNIAIITIINVYIM